MAESEGILVKERRAEGKRRPVRVLLVEDNPADARLIEESLLEAATGDPASHAFLIVWVETLARARAALSAGELDLILLDLSLPDGNGMELLTDGSVTGRQLPVVVLTGLDDQSLALSALEHGAQDYVLKGRPASTALVRVLRYAMERQRLVRQLDDQVGALRRSEALLAEAQRIAHLGCWDWDLRSNTLHWSEEIYRIFGLVPGAPPLTYQQFLEWVHPEDRERVERGVNEALAGLQPYAVEHRIRRPDGVERIVHEEAEVAWEAGEAVRMTGTVHDVSERKRAEQAVRELNATLERRVAERTAELTASNRELESFIYSVSHDLRAPLRHIGGFAQMLLEQGPLAPDALHCAQRIQTAARHLGALVDDLLELARVARQPPQFRVTELEPLAREVVASLAPETEGRKVEWRIGALPAVKGDATLLRQVLINVFSNALKFTRPRDPAVIEAGVETTARGPAVFVRDNGVGFEMKYADRLFGVFQRLHRAEEFEGTGVGLAIVQRIVQKHGGTAWAESAPGQGCTVYFTLAGQANAAEPEVEYARTA